MKTATDMTHSRRAVLSTLSASAAIAMTAVWWRWKSPARAHSVDSQAPLKLQIREFPRELRRADSSVDKLVDLKSLSQLLLRLSPAWTAFKISKVLHAFRLWGPQSTFLDDVFSAPAWCRTFSGKELLQLLSDDRTYRNLVPDEPSLLISSEFGIRTRRSPHPSPNFVGQFSHDGDLIAAFAEQGLPSSWPIVADKSTGSICDLLRQHAAEFTANQELEWSVEAFARYLVESKWSNRFGEVFSLDHIANKLLTGRMGSGACLGTHKPYALCCLYRLSESDDLLTHQTKSRIGKYLGAVTKEVLNSRRKDGCWSGAWTSGAESMGESAAAEEFAMLTSTSHHLEWMALAPKSLRPPDDVLHSAIDGVLKHVNEMPRLAIEGNYLPLSHLARALCLMADRHPVDIVSHVATR